MVLEFKPKVLLLLGKGSTGSCSPSPVMTLKQTSLSLETVVGNLRKPALCLL